MKLFGEAAVQRRLHSGGRRRNWEGKIESSASWRQSEWRLHVGFKGSCLHANQARLPPARHYVRCETAQIVDSYQCR